MMDIDKLLFRRQFILSSVQIDKFYSWNEKEVAGKYFLRSHPDLELTQVKKENIELTLLGFFIDPYFPGRSNKDILCELTKSNEMPEGLIKSTFRLCGRWILIVVTQRDFFIFNDPTGLRSLFYTDFNIGSFYCASQPGIIADICKFKYSDEFKDDFINSDYHKNDREYWIPSGALYKDILALTPNHYLDLKKNRIVRFWPYKKLEKFKLNESVEKSSILLKQILESAAKRYQLALPITAGLDSRTILAASKDIRDKIYYYTLIYYDLTPKSPDMKIPMKLLKSLGLEHHVLDCSSVMDDYFKIIYMKNVDMAHEVWGGIAYGLYEKFPQDRVCVKGNIIEIAKCFYYNKQYPHKINGKTLAQISGFGFNNFARHNFDKWYRKSKTICKEFEIEILDLFYWEQRLANWQAQSQLEWDIAQETISPYNCLNLLELFLSVDNKFRKLPEFTMYKNMIKILWPKLLEEPINPVPLTSKIKIFKSSVIQKFKRTSSLKIFYNSARKVYRKYFKE